MRIRAHFKLENEVSSDMGYLWYSDKNGMARLYNTISTHSYHPNLKHIIELFVQEFDICQIIKLPVSGSGCLPPAVFYSLHSFKWQWILLDHGLSSSTHKTFLFKGSHVLTMSPI